MHIIIMADVVKEPIMKYVFPSKPIMKKAIIF